jgi:uncharacterized repeat protein (TIGR03803 family)
VFRLHPPPTPAGGLYANCNWRSPRADQARKPRNRRFLLPVMIAGLGLILVGPVKAQTFTNLYNFTAEYHNSAVGQNTNNDGGRPYAGLILGGDAFYGTASDGGSSGWGTVFKVNTGGAGFTNLHTFAYDSDGANPYARLILSGNTLYGTTSAGGSSGGGTVFALSIDGTGFTNLHSFAYTNDGAYPQAGLTFSGNALYGTAYAGGSGGNGTVFAVNTDGTGFTNLHTFTTGEYDSFGVYTNNDGANPSAGLITNSSGNTLYGAAKTGGSGGNGTVFAVNTDGTGFTNLYTFTATSGPLATNSDGAGPLAGLILSGSTLFGTTSRGGSSGSGTVFAVDTGGAGFTNLHDFTGGSGGAYPVAGLVISYDTLFGTTAQGGGSSAGMVFGINTNGTGFTNLHDFTPLNNGTNLDGAGPHGGMILSAHTLFGTATQGGSAGIGTVFSFSLPPPRLAIIHSGANVVLTWPANAAGFTLQSTTNLGSTAVWSTNSPAPVIVNGRNAVTNPAAGTRQFYRLGP